MEQWLTELPNMTVVAGMVWILAMIVVLFTLGISWNRSSYPGWRTWACGHSAMVLGLLIGTLRTPQTLLLCVLVGNGLVMLGSVLYLNSVQRFSGRPPSKPMLMMQFGAGLGIVVALLILTVGVDMLSARFLLVSAYLIAVLVAFVRLTLTQMRQQPALRSAYRLQLGVLAAVCLLTAPRSLRVGSNLSVDSAFAMNVPNLLMYLAVLLLSVGGTFAFWILHEDRRRQDVGRLNDELTVQAQRDPLTSLLNRRGLWEAFARWAGQRDGHATLLVMDVNEFKAINDQHGHAAGDQCLIQMGEILCSVAQPGDLVSRVGGDEFILILTGASAQVEEQLTSLEARFLAVAETPLTFTASIGRTHIAMGEALDRAVNRADEAMYGNKVARQAIREQDAHVSTRGLPVPPRAPVVWIDSREVG